MVEIRRQRFDNIIGQPAYFFAEDVMINPFGDKPGVPIPDYQRAQSDGPKKGLLVQGIVEGTEMVFTPQYFRDLTEPVWVVHLRHTEVSKENGKHIHFSVDGPRSLVRIDRIYGWYDSREADLLDETIAA
ncbi:hypothetical protein A3J32_00910 [Candidatus Saccharibacteria bacterium RIFCSPLOWO2_02_FULL_46_7]|nr:MAG: hypothetical protein A3J32_00910 [Candidatus Saccharibacteria bacterium RIFCSPLOWO2_02_FULL_46_7]